MIKRCLPTLIIALMAANLSYAMDLGTPTYQFACSKVFKVEGPVERLNVSSDSSGGLLIGAITTEGWEKTLNICDVNKNKWQKIIKRNCGVGCIIMRNHKIFGSAVIIRTQDNQDNHLRCYNFVWDKNTDSVKKLSESLIIIGVDEDVFGREIYLTIDEPSRFLTIRDAESGELLQTITQNLGINGFGDGSIAFRKMSDGTLMVVFNNFTEIKVFKIGPSNQEITQPRKSIFDATNGYPTRKTILYENKNNKPRLIEIVVGIKELTCIRDVATGKKIYTFSSPYINDITYDKIEDRNVMVVGTTQGYIELWDLDTDKPKKLHSFKAHNEGPIRVAIRNKCSFPQIVSANKTTIKVWDCIQQRECFKEADKVLTKTGNFPAELVTMTMGYAGSDEGLQQRIEPPIIPDEDENVVPAPAVPVGHSSAHEGSLEEVAEEIAIDDSHDNRVDQHNASLYSWLERNRSWILGGAIVTASTVAWLWKTRR